MSDIKSLLESLQADLDSGTSPKILLKDRRLKAAWGQLKDLPDSQRASQGRLLNEFQQELKAGRAAPLAEAEIDFFDVTAPQGKEPGQLIPADQGSIHPLMQARTEVLDILLRLGFSARPARLIDSQYYMFDSLNFPPNHPARDDYDTFNLDQTDPEGKTLIAPSHTSTMQNRVLRDWVEAGCPEPLAVVVPGRVFRNEDVDARHDHIFYQIEGVYVSRGVTVAHLIATLKAFIQAYYRQELELKIQPSYFPFTEPSLELAISCPFCQQSGSCRVCSEGWLEVLGGGLIHPNVLTMAGVDAKKYTGFAWGVGLTRLTMIKHNIEDIRHFTTAKLDFLRQF